MRVHELDCHAGVAVRDFARAVDYAHGAGAERAFDEEAAGEAGAGLDGVGVGWGHRG